MRELRAVALSEDGGYLVLAETAGGPDPEKFRVPVDDRLRTVLRGGRRSEVRQESALTPREIQARLRAGETTAEVARVAGIPVERVERYEGPVLAERARVVQEARAALLPKDPGGAPGRPLGEVVDARLMAAQDDPGGAQWDAWRRVDGIWLVQLTSESRCARWTWDPVVRRVRPHDDAARALVAPEVAADPTAQPAPAPPPVQAGPARPPGPALTLVQEPAATPAAPSAHPPVVVTPPTPVQPASARGRTHGASRPAARGEAPARVPAPPAAPVRSAQSQPPEAVVPVVDVRGAEVRDVRPAPAAPGVPALPAAAAAAAPGSGPAPTPTAAAVTEPELAVAVPPVTAVPLASGVSPQPPSTPEPAPGPEPDDTGQPPRGRQGAPARAAERGAGGRRGRKSVPAWDDIVFGARRP
ncbi:septation protein SepH [Frankia sp. Cj5]|uniref:septation protein SepH n=2 Tax=unclassified Frankia TaxID=2632575 RepID=UPI001EF52BE9|nr:septation protein SepH [Frankia sp. Cj5]